MPYHLRIREQRRARRWTRRELAERAEIPVEAVEDLEKSDPRWLDMPVIERIAEALEVQPADLIERRRGF